MSDEKAPALGDFFKSKAKKKIKATNLNNAKTEAKPEEKKSKTKPEDDQWNEEEVVAATIKGVEVAGKLQKEEDEKGDEGKTVQAWGSLKGAKDSSTQDKKKYPSLKDSVKQSTINIGDGEAKVNIETSKNRFQDLEGGEDSDDERRKPTEINPAMVSKKKGEREKDVVKRAVDEAKKPDVKNKKKKDKKYDDEDEDEDEDEEEDEQEEEAPPAEEEKERKKPEKKKTAKDEAKAVEPKEEVAKDPVIQTDPIASKKKYENRRKKEPVDIPEEELEEEKENRVKTQAVDGKKKKANQVVIRFPGTKPHGITLSGSAVKKVVETAKTKGVQVGWKILSVDDQDCDDMDEKDIEKLLKDAEKEAKKSSKPFSIVFDKAASLEEDKKLLVLAEDDFFIPN